MSRQWAAVSVAGAALLLAGACSNGSDGKVQAKSQANNAADAQVTITPANGEDKARPDKGVSVSANSGKLQQVTVQADGKPVEGQLSQDGATWTTKWPLKPGTSYDVNATAKSSSGKATTQTAKFSTLKYKGPAPAASLDWILQGAKNYGVGLPIILNFDQAVHNKENVEKALEVKAEKPVEGAWRWISDTTVIYRTKEYWQPHQKVTLNAHLEGVRMAKGVYGKKDFNHTFKIAESKVSTINLKSKRMSVKVDGKKKWSYGISAGNGQTHEYTTSSGKSVAMEKGALVVMESPNREKGDPGYYKIPINYAVRFTSSGQYVHQTKGETYCLGKRNCSHGCVRQPSKQALWYFKNVHPGDPIITKGSRRKTEPLNGWSFFSMSFEAWKKGSAIK